MIGAGRRLGREIAGVAFATVNVFDLVLRDAGRNWFRSRRTVTPAVGSMALLLLVAGAAGLGALAIADIARAATSEASFLHVYLRDEATPQQVDSLSASLAADRSVVAVRYVSAEEALSAARTRPGLAGLAADAAVNPFPPTLDVQLRRSEDADRVAKLVGADPAVDPTLPSSYDSATYRNIHLVWIIAVGSASAVVGLLALIAIVITLNAIRAAVVARRDDIAIMRLVGASGWMIRAPFVIEGALTGIAAGVVAAGLLIALYAGTESAGARLFTDLLPGVGWATAAACASLLVVAGASFGSFASLFGLRRIRA
jgi:cell division transport system permease protein